MDVLLLLPGLSHQIHRVGRGIDRRRTNDSHRREVGGYLTAFELVRDHGRARRAVGEKAGGPQRSQIGIIRVKCVYRIAHGGDKDDVVPYSHATRFKEALDKVKVKNELYTIKGGGHGGFTQAEFVGAYNEIWKFLRDNKIFE